MCVHFFYQLRPIISQGPTTKKRKTLSVEKPAAHVLHTTEIQPAAAEVDTEFDYDLFDVDLDAADGILQELVDNAVNATGKQPPRVADFDRQEPTDVDDLRRKVRQLEEHIETQDSRIARQDKELRSLHQRLATIEMAVSRPPLHQPHLQQLPPQPEQQIPPHPQTETEQPPAQQHPQAQQPPPPPPQNQDELPHNIMTQLMSHHDDCRKVARCLVEYYFTTEERVRCNTSGMRGAEKLDPIRMQKVREYTFRISPIPHGLQGDTWKRCLQSIDALRRHNKRKCNVNE
ncbi:uncharacterized protein [Antedon mediterranea]|uniref:uncharacterized protein n=1 Tax=Antedon mediterranea TaxID=105859 RepID=UPI003AF51B8E